MRRGPDNRSILERINEAANEIQALYRQAGKKRFGMSRREQERLWELQAELAWLWHMRRVELSGRPSVWDRLRLGR